MNEQDAHSRWEHYFMRSGCECAKFWRGYLSDPKRKVLVILGLGFDPRMCYGLRMLIEANPTSVEKCFLIKYMEGPNSPSLEYQKRVDANLAELQALLKNREGIREVNVRMVTEDGRRIGSRRSSDAIDEAVVKQFTDIVIDISAMPRGIYFPIITKLLYLLDANAETGEHDTAKNLHVLVSEQVSVDEKIQEEGIDDQAAYMHGFSSDLVQEATAGAPRIWIPVLGEGRNEQLVRIYDHVRPDEICPVFPSPSLDPRRGDDLVGEYRELLFDRLRVEPLNIIYASEKNPFEVYRQICRTIERYNNALDALGKCKIVVSALSSKLLSVGALLAAYEAKRKGFMIGISHVETHGYRIQDEIGPCDPELYSLWIAGECYGA